MPFFSIADVLLARAIIRKTKLEYLEGVLFLLGWGLRRKENGKCTSAGAAHYSTEDFITVETVSTMAFWRRH